MANPSRLSKLGTSGKTGSVTNINDPFIRTIEFPVVAVASGAEQLTNVQTPSQSMQVISSYLRIITAEATATVKTVDIGVTSQSAATQSGTDVSATGNVGTPVTAAFSVSAGDVFTFTLAGADFVELDAICFVTYQGVDAPE